MAKQVDISEDGTLIVNTRFIEGCFMKENDHSITFIDEIDNRKVTYDAPRFIEFLENGAVKIRCQDNFQTIIGSSEWTKIEIESWL